MEAEAAVGGALWTDCCSLGRVWSFHEGYISRSFDVCSVTEALVLLRPNQRLVFPEPPRGRTGPFWTHIFIGDLNGFMWTNRRTKTLELHSGLMEDGTEAAGPGSARTSWTSEQTVCIVEKNERIIFIFCSVHAAGTLG